MFNRLQYMFNWLWYMMKQNAFHGAGQYIRLTQLLQQKKCHMWAFTAPREVAPMVLKALYSLLQGLQFRLDHQSNQQSVVGLVYKSQS